MNFLSKNIEETFKIATDFSKQLNRRAPSATARATVVGLYGELGSGKTTFIKYLAKSFGIEETIQSPTYVIMKRHEIRDTSNEVRKKLNPPNIVTRNSCFVFFFHIDAYRIEKEEEMLNLGWLKIISDPKNLICIEWPENISGIMPEHTMIKFEHVKDLEKASETERKISIA